jgi:hypothetical protein
LYYAFGRSWLCQDHRARHARVPRVTTVTTCTGLSEIFTGTRMLGCCSCASTANISHPHPRQSNHPRQRRNTCRASRREGCRAGEMRDISKLPALHSRPDGRLCGCAGESVRSSTRIRATATGMEK